MNDQLSLAKKLSYGVGHVLNDLTASMWFSYLLIYLHRVIRFDDSLSGYMMLLGI
jgi:Na+/melibiose symporter-like transporter